MLREALDWIDAGLGNQWFHLRCMVGTFIPTGGKSVYTVLKSTKRQMMLLTHSDKIGHLVADNAELAMQYKLVRETIETANAFWLAMYSNQDSGKGAFPDSD